tara:strand:- start:5333 stop:6955 length:1623 start_codon:yes stop_codon:yes gene_type:complete
LIIGDNGAGKSTVLDALTYGLFNKPFRKINKPQLISSVNEKGCLVEVEFSIGRRNYTVRRGMRPAIFEIVKDGTILNQSASARDYQSILEKTILKLNFKSFTQIVILGNSSFVPFMQLPAAHRREVIEDLLDIQIFSIMNQLLKEKISDNKEAQRTVEFQIELKGEKIALQEAHLTSLKVNNQKKIKDNEAQIKKSQEAIQDHEDTIEGLHQSIADDEASITDQKVVRTRHTKVSNIITQLQTQVRNLKKNLKFYEDNDECPTCRQSLGGDHVHKTVADDTSKLEEAQNAIVALGDKFTVGTVRIADIEQVVKRIAEHFQNLSIEQNSITHLQEYINTYLQENENLQEHKESLKDEASKLRDMKKELRDHNKDKEKLVKTRAIFEVGARLLKDNGVKTKIIRQYIPVINKLVNKYLASMDFFVNFELNEAFHETIKSRHRDTFSYASFSEGEKQRIDLALLLTWRAVARMKNSVATNLMMLDEVFDASLDANGTEELMKILQSFGNETNIFVISHKQEALVDKFMDTIRFMKRGNFSEIV